MLPYVADENIYTHGGQVQWFSRDIKTSYLSARNLDAEWIALTDVYMYIHGGGDNEERKSRRGPMMKANIWLGVAFIW